MTDYFSDRELGPKPRNIEDIGLNVWGGFVAAITNRAEDGSLGYAFPDRCSDYPSMVCGCDEVKLALMIEAEIPGLEWRLDRSVLPSKYDILDLLEAIYRSIAYPNQENYHSFLRHYHLSFDVEKGRQLFRDEINRIFSRNSIAFEMNTEGRIIRLTDEVLKNDLIATLFNTGDTGLDILLETARRKYLSPHPDTRKEGLDKLWDAWERLKTIDSPDKSEWIKNFLRSVAMVDGVIDRLGCVDISA